MLYFSTTYVFVGVCLSVVCNQLSNHLFEELAMDVYDEVDRRENETSESTDYCAWQFWRSRHAHWFYV